MLCIQANQSSSQCQKGIIRQFKMRWQLELWKTRLPTIQMLCRQAPLNCKKKTIFKTDRIQKCKQVTLTHVVIVSGVMVSIQLFVMNLKIT